MDKEQIRIELLTLINELLALYYPEPYPNQDNIKRVWLNMIVDVANEEIAKLRSWKE